MPARTAPAAQNWRAAQLGWRRQGVPFQVWLDDWQVQELSLAFTLYSIN